MDSITGFTTALAGLKTASELTTRLREALSSREVKLDEVVARIIEIQGLISDGRTALIDVQEQILEKNKEIYRLELESQQMQQQLTKRQQGRIHDNAVWKVLDEGSEEGPYCPNCYAQTGNFIQPNVNYADDTKIDFYCKQHGSDAFCFSVDTRLAPQYRPRGTSFY